MLLDIAIKLLLYFKNCVIYFDNRGKFSIFIINFNYHRLPPKVTSPRTHIVPITGVQVIDEDPSGTTACKSNDNSATMDRYVVPQFDVISGVAKSSYRPRAAGRDWRSRAAKASSRASTSFGSRMLTFSPGSTEGPGDQASRRWGSLATTRRPLHNSAGRPSR